MNYYSGKEISVGDRVQLWQGKLGRVVCDLDKRVFSDDYPESDWGYLEIGILIAADDGDVFHHEEFDEDLELIE